MQHKCQPACGGDWSRLASPADPARLIYRPPLEGWSERETGMIDNRELNMDDYLAMLRRRLKVILIPALLAPLAGFLISFAFPSKYTSQSLILVEEQEVPEGYVKPVVTEDLTQRVITMQQQVLSRNQL